MSCVTAIHSTRQREGRRLTREEKDS